MAHRRRGVGVGRAGPGYKKKAEELKAVSITSAMETVKKLEEKLTEFAKKHRHEIQNDPAFRTKFLEMCGPLGVDPLSSEKSFWTSLLGIGEFYYELAIKVAEVCLASRSRNGGIISVSEVRSILLKSGTKFRFANQKSSKKYGEQDIVMAIQKLSKLGSGFRTVDVGKTKMIVSVPTELDQDHMEVMDLAQKNGGMVTVKDLNEMTGWTNERSRRALDLLLGKGMAWLDVYHDEHNYWFPSVWKEGIESISQNDAK